MKRKLSILLFVVVTVIVTLIIRHFMAPVFSFFSPPRVTVINLSGEDVSDIKISLGQYSVTIPVLEDGEFKTVPIHGKFGEASTHIRWRDSAGGYDADANDYMTPYGGFHSHILLTEDRKIRVVYENFDWNNDKQCN